MTWLRLSGPSRTRPTSESSRGPVPRGAGSSLRWEGLTVKGSRRGPHAAPNVVGRLMAPLRVCWGPMANGTLRGVGRSAR